MKILKMALLSVIANGLAFSFAFGAVDMAKGKSLFNDSKLGVLPQAGPVTHAILMEKV